MYDNCINLQLVYHFYQTNTTQQGVPYVEIPLNASMCEHAGPNNHTSTYLIDTCGVMPQIAREISHASSGSLTCTSSVHPDCNTLSCSSLADGSMMTYTILPCHVPPAVMVSFSSGNHSVSTGPLVMNLTSSQMIDNSISVEIVQHRSNLSLGFEV